ncbi:class A beta-lactamase [Shewanella xiamenensis]|uniref:class A beta-lactamase n=1 Tax=Shewanella xiamenensis TaxID=332186 RepID=UPI0021C02314|nr:class A beta-lactamase [Shewanella xiamenensis]MCT8864630.1 class A beta-lactamase [Shewanella xiamenensis]MCT8875266.1 class A beta-lactamase [Shewanella xiamenensis]
MLKKLSDYKKTTLIAICLMSISNSNASPLSVKQTVNEFERQGWNIGVSVIENSSNNVYSINGDERFSTNSTVKALACAIVLSEVDKNAVSLNDAMMINEQDVVSHSPVMKEFIGKKVTLADACKATMTYSDNTAANFAIKKSGGPEGITSFLRSIGDDITRADRYEPDLNTNPEGDLRDTSTANTMAANFNKLLLGNILSTQSKEQLKNWMMGNKVADNMLRLVLPTGWEIADRTGANSYGARGIISMVWSESQQPLIISIYIKKEKTSIEEREKVISEIGRVIFTEYTNGTLF